MEDRRVLPHVRRDLHQLGLRLLHRIPMFLHDVGAQRIATTEAAIADRALEQS